MLALCVMYCVLKVRLSDVLDILMLNGVCEILFTDLL